MRHSPKPGDYAILSASAQHSIVKEIQRLRKQKQLPKLSAGNQGTRAIMQEPRGPTAQAPFFVARKRATDYTQKAIKPVKQALIHTLNLGPCCDGLIVHFAISRVISNDWCTPRCDVSQSPGNRHERARCSFGFGLNVGAPLCEQVTCTDKHRSF